VGQSPPLAEVHALIRLARCPLLAATLALAASPLTAQQGTLSTAERQKRLDTEKELLSLAAVERKVMVPMRDGVRLATDVYRPRIAAGPVPIVFVQGCGRT
jgi:predicted acyl esterase